MRTLSNGVGEIPLFDRCLLIRTSGTKGQATHGCFDPRPWFGSKGWTAALIAGIERAWSTSHKRGIRNTQPRSLSVYHSS